MKNDDFLDVNNEETYIRFATARDDAGKKYRLAGINFEDKQIQLLSEIRGKTATFTIGSWQSYQFYCQCCCFWYSFTEVAQEIYPGFLYCKTSHRNMQEIIDKNL